MGMNEIQEIIKPSELLEWWRYFEGIKHSIDQNPSHHYTVEFYRAGTDCLLGAGVSMNFYGVALNIARVQKQIGKLMVIVVKARSECQHKSDIEEIKTAYNDNKEIAAFF